MPPSKPVTSPSPAAPVALITGAARRIGRAIALAMARDGWHIAVHYRRSREEAAELVEELERTGSRAVALAADLGDVAAAGSLVSRCREQLGPPTCLVNNASEFLLDTVATLDPETWDKHLDINLKTPVFLAKQLYLGLPDGVEGNVINIIDQRVWNLTPEFFSYTISKAGLWTATRTLAQALAPRVRVNAIGPGPVLASVHQTPEEFAAECASTLLGRGPESEEIPAAVRFILSARSMTGQMIALDGGQHLLWEGAENLTVRGREAAASKP